MEEYRNTLFIPGFISRQHSLGNRSGKVDGSVLICDIAGFTGLTESLFAEKKRGAEQLSEILNGLFTMMIQMVRKRRGFIADFAGDAFTAIFPADDCTMAQLAAKEISRGVMDMLTEDASRFIRGIRSGISSGTILWNIHGSGPFAYLFSGEPVKEAAAAEASAAPGEIRVVRSPQPHTGALEEPEAWEQPDMNIQRLFVHPDYIARSSIPEFRDVSAVFTGFDGICSMDDFIDGMLGASREYGGYFNLLDCGDKGNIVFTIFGAPLTSGRNHFRSVSYALALQERFGACVRSGISSGGVFAGFIGSPGERGHYTVLGDTVNAAARLLENCPRGAIRVSAEMGSTLPECFRTERHSAYGGAVCCTVTGRAANPGDLDFDNIFIGRKELLEPVLRFAKETREKKQAGALVVTGEAGIGKTRFVLELASKLPDTELIYLKCDEILRKSLNPVESFFEEIFRTSGSEGSASGPVFERNFVSVLSRARAEGAGAYHALGLERLQFVIRGFMGIDEGGVYARLDPRARFDNTILAFRHLAGLLAGRRRPLVVVDDFQWIDKDSHAALRELFSQMEIESPLLCAVTRTHDDTNASGLMPKGARKIPVDLEPLSLLEQNEMIDSSFQVPPSPALRELIAEKAEGNPFFMEQMIRYLEETSMISPEAGITELVSPEINLPGSIVEMIISRIDALEDEIQSTVRNASVLGRRFNVRVLSGMLRDMPVNRHLATGDEAGIWNRLTELQYIFRHALIRDAIYGMQMEKQLMRLHLLAGNIIEKLYAHDERMFRDLSYHFERSGQTDRMLKYTLLAAEYAGANFRNREAISMYRKYLGNQTEPGGRTHAKQSLAEIYRITGEWEKAMDLFDELVRQGRENGDPGLLANSLNKKGFLLHRMGLNEEALQLMTAAGDLHKSLEEYRGLASVHNNIGTVYIDLNRLDDAIKALNEGLWLLEALDDNGSNAETAMFICSNLGLAYQKKNSLEKASDYYRKSMEIGEETNSRWSLAALNFGNIMYLQNRYEEAERYYLRAMNHAQETGDRHLTRVMLNNIAAISVAGGDYTRALDIYEEALVLATSLNDRKGIRLLCQNMGEIKTLLGDFEGAEASFGEAVETAQRLSDDRALGTAMGKAGWMRLMTGKPSEAVPMLTGGADHSLKADNPQAALEFMFYLCLAFHETGMGDLEELTGRMEVIPSERLSEDIRWRLPVAKLLALHRAGNDDATLKAAHEAAEGFTGTEAEGIAGWLVWKLTGNRCFRERAALVYGKLFEEAPLPYYRMKLLELGRE